MRRIKNPKIGEYVLLTKYRDKDMNDPWHLGWLSAYMIDGAGKYYMCEGSDRWFGHCFRLTEKEGHEWLLKYKVMTNADTEGDGVVYLKNRIEELENE